VTKHLRERFELRFRSPTFFHWILPIKMTFSAKAGISKGPPWSCRTPTSAVTPSGCKTRKKHGSRRALQRGRPDVEILVSNFIYSNILMSGNAGRILDFTLIFEIAIFWEENLAYDFLYNIQWTLGIFGLGGTSERALSNVVL
jgi:hypothetical protein